MLKFQKADADNLRKFSMDKSQANTLEIVPVDYIRPNPYQPRRAFSEESLNELAQSIKQYGLLQPITVRKLSHNYYEIIAGERRWRAVCKAGFTHIKAVIQPGGSLNDYQSIEACNEYGATMVFTGQRSFRH